MTAPNDEWAELRRRAETAIAEANQILEERAQRLAGAGDQGQAVVGAEPDRPSWRWPVVEASELQQPRAAPLRPRAVAPYRDWKAEQHWVEQIADQRIGPALAQLRKEQATVLAGLADALGAEVARLLGRERAVWRAELGALEKRCGSLKKRLAALEKADEQQRAEPAPRMVPRVA